MREEREIKKAFYVHVQNSMKRRLECVQRLIEHSFYILYTSRRALGLR